MIGVTENIKHQLTNVAHGLYAECASTAVDMAGFVRVEVVSVEEQIDGSFLVRIVERVEDKPAKRASKKAAPDAEPGEDKGVE